MLVLNYSRKALCFFISTLALCGAYSCDSDEKDNGLEDPNVDASFAIEQVEGESNSFYLKAQTKNVIASKWNVGDGYYHGKMTEKVSFPDAGNYTISHIAIGRGGAEKEATKVLKVETSDPLKGNMIKGGNFANATDHALWKTLYLSTNDDAKWVFNTGSATIHSKGNWAQEAIYQAIEVVKDQEYTIDMLVSSANGSNNTYFEVYAGTSAPVAGEEYKDNMIMGLSTWEGCATTAFSGKLSTVGCVKNASGAVTNVVKFKNSGTIYLVIRSGGETFTPSGITVSKIEFRRK